MFAEGGQRAAGSGHLVAGSHGHRGHVLGQPHRLPHLPARGRAPRQRR